MLNFVRVVAFAQLVGGCLWLWAALFPKRLTPMDYARAIPNLPDEPVTVPPLPGAAMIGSGTISLAVTSRQKSSEGKSSSFPN